jgi:Protein of Unknown function (DUF2784)
MQMLRNAIADLIAAAHISYFLFVVGGCAAITIGAAWNWIRNPWFRLSHLAAVYIVVLENVFNIPCPLNTAEWQLRSSSGPAIKASSDIGGLLDQLLFHTIPGSVLTWMYYCLAVLLIIALIAVPPRFARASKVLESM